MDGPPNMLVPCETGLAVLLELATVWPNMDGLEGCCVAGPPNMLAPCAAEVPKTEPPSLCVVPPNIDPVVG